MPKTITLFFKLKNFTMNNQITLRIPTEIALPDNDQWQHRFEIKSESSDRIYVVSQNKKRRHWACSCPGYKRHRTCKHLQAIGLPTNERPYEPKIISE
jgi:hypothetical protein